MKKFTISALVAMGAVVLSSAAFAGSTPANIQGMNNYTSAVDTIVPNDTLQPEQKDTTVKTGKTEETAPACLVAFSDTVVPNDTITPKDTVAPEKKTEETPQKENGGETAPFAGTMFSMK